MDIENLKKLLPSQKEVVVLELLHEWKKQRGYGLTASKIAGRRIKELDLKEAEVLLKGLRKKKYIRISGIDIATDEYEISREGEFLLTALKFLYQVLNWPS